jgi:hypothetical protein
MSLVETQLTFYGATIHLETEDESMAEKMKWEVERLGNAFIEVKKDGKAEKRTW